MTLVCIFFACWQQLLCIRALYLLQYLVWLWKNNHKYIATIYSYSQHSGARICSDSTQTQKASIYIISDSAGNQQIYSGWHIFEWNWSQKESFVGSDKSQLQIIKNILNYFQFVGLDGFCCRLMRWIMNFKTLFDTKN